MLKKVTACLMALFVLPILLYAQIADENGVASFGTSYLIEEILPDDYQIQHIQWKSINRARGYEIELQIQDGNGIWTEAGSWETKKTEYDLNLVPGTYRFRISALNAIGKKSGTSDWAEFDVFESTQPFLQRNSFPESSRYGIPAIRRSVQDEYGTEVISIRGVNCFDDDTVFSLVPSDITGSQIKSVYDRSTVRLPVASSNPDKHVVQLTLDWNLVEFGPYKLVVENGSRGQDYLEVLVQPDRMPQLSIPGLEYNEVLQSDCLNLSESGGFLSFDVKNAQFDTEFTLTPVENPDNAYPFASGFNRTAMKIANSLSANGRVSVRVDSSQQRAGWYELSAVTPDAGRTVIRFLLTDYVTAIPEITDVSGKVDVDTQMLAVTVKTDKVVFSEDQTDKIKLFCISEKNEMGNNKRFQLRLISVARNGKSAVFEIPASSLEPAQYALMLETPEGARIVFFKTDSRFKLSMSTLSEDEVEQQFLIAPTEEILAARAAEQERLKLEDIKYPEYLPAFHNNSGNSWTLPYSTDFPPSVAVTEDTVRLAVTNNRGEQKFSSLFKVSDRKTLDLLRSSEGISFESMVTNRNNGRTKWSFELQTADGSINVPLNSKLNKLSQTVLKWEDYDIDPESITSVAFKVNVNDPHDPGWTNKLEIYEAKTYSSLEPVKQLRVKYPFLFTKVTTYAGVFLSEDFSLKDEFPDLEQYYDVSLGTLGIPSSVHLNVYDCDWLSVNAVYQPRGMGSTMRFGGEFALSIPSDVFRLYGGLGWSYWGQSDWVETYAGFVLKKYFDIRFSLFKKTVPLPSSTAYGSPLLSWDATWLQIGANIPLRKKTIHYVEAEKAAETPVLFTEASIGFDMSSSENHPSSDAIYLPDISLNIRPVGFRNFALDTSVAVRDISVGNVTNFGVLDMRVESDLILPFKVFKQDFAVDYAIGAGWWYDNYQQNNHIYFSESLGLRLGNYVKLKASCILFEDSWDDALDYVNKAPYLAPFLCPLVNDYWTVGVSLSIPLRMY